MTKTTVSGKPVFTRILCLFSLFAVVCIATGHLGIHSAEAAQANLSWVAPTTNSDGTPLTDLAGFKLHSGNAPGSYQQVVDVGNKTDYTLGSLNDGSTYYFAVTAYDTSMKESAYSNEVSRNFPALPAVYVVTATAGTGGTITAQNNPNANQASNGTVTVTSVSVNQGASQAFTVAAAAGYRVLDVVMDGVSVGPVASYNFSTVSANHAIAASFAVTAPNPAAKAGDCDGNGIVSIAEVQVAVNMYLGLKSPASCVDLDNSGTVSISELQMAINAFLGQ
jgi:hypothetical protein